MARGLRCFSFMFAHGLNTLVLLASFTLAATAVLPSSVRAGDTPVASEQHLSMSPVAAERVVPASPTDEQWYGSETLALDATALVLGVAVPALFWTFKSEGWHETAAVTSLAIGAVTYVVAAPTIHGLHSNSHGIWISLLLRVGLPVVGAVSVVGAIEEAENTDERTDMPLLTILAVAGVVSAPIVDALIAWEPRTKQSPVVFSVAPLRSGQGAVLVLHGSFL